MRRVCLRASRFLPCRQPFSLPPPLWTRYAVSRTLTGAAAMGDVDVLDAPPEKAAPALEYKADPGRVSVRGFRLLLILTLVNTTLLGAWVMGPQLFPFLRQQWTQWRAERAKRQAEAAAQQAAAAKKQLALSLQQQCL